LQYVIIIVHQSLI